MYLSTEIPGLHVPMMTAIDYRGERRKSISFHPYLSIQVIHLIHPLMTHLSSSSGNVVELPTLGRRLIAASDLPISGKKTIIYGNGTTFLEMESKCSVQSLSKNRIVLLGSDDAAQTVHTDSAECNELMRKVSFQSLMFSLFLFFSFVFLLLRTDRFALG